MVIMMMVMMVAGRFRRGICPRGIWHVLRLGQGNAATCAELVSLAIRTSTCRADLPARVFSFRVHVHRIFHTLFQGKSLYGLEHSRLGWSNRFAIIHGASDALGLGMRNLELPFPCWP